MKYDPNEHHRRSIRLPDYDYAQAGAYFVTICTYDRQCLFGRVEDAEMRVSCVGEIAEECWRAIPMHFAEVKLDAFVVMPNHVHGIIIVGAADVGATHASPVRDGGGGGGGGVGALHASPVRDGGGGGGVGATHASPVQQFRGGMPQGPKQRSVGAIIGSYKSAVSRKIHEIGGTAGPAIWHRNYYECIIRNEESLNRIRQYIMNNPASWMLDRENPQAKLYGQEECIEQG